MTQIRLAYHDDPIQNLATRLGVRILTTNDRGCGLPNTQIASETELKTQRSMPDPKLR